MCARPGGRAGGVFPQKSDGWSSLTPASRLLAGASRGERVAAGTPRGPAARGRRARPRGRGTRGFPRRVSGVGPCWPSAHRPRRPRENPAPTMTRGVAPRVASTRELLAADLEAGGRAGQPPPAEPRRPRERAGRAGPGAGSGAALPGRCPRCSGRKKPAADLPCCFVSTRWSTPNWEERDEKMSIKL